MKLFWLDLETTGLDPIRDSILEVAILEADLRDPFSTHLSVRQWILPLPVGTVLSPFIQEMHTKNGLLSECGGVQHQDNTVEKVESYLLNMVPWVEASEDRPTLAGSSVHFDHGFLKVHMPELAKRFMHRYYDVSAIKLFCRSLGMERVPKAEAHRAADDVLESIQHAQHCVNWLKYGWKQ